jgi:hypothetical protein
MGKIRRRFDVQFKIRICEVIRASLTLLAQAGQQPRLPPRFEDPQPFVLQLQLVQLQLHPLPPVPRSRRRGGRCIGLRPYPLFPLGAVSILRSCTANAYLVSHAWRG